MLTLLPASYRPSSLSTSDTILFVTLFRIDATIPTIIHSRPVALASTREYLKGEGALAYRRAQEEAEADNVFGVPLFIFEREPFWGHDRKPVLEQRLTEAGLAIKS
jgi:hypothetical protein